MVCERSFDILRSCVVCLCLPPIIVRAVTGQQIVEQQLIS